MHPYGGLEDPLPHEKEKTYQRRKVVGFFREFSLDMPQSWHWQGSYNKIDHINRLGKKIALFIDQLLQLKLRQRAFWWWRRVGQYAAHLYPASHFVSYITHKMAQLYIWGLSLCCQVSTESSHGQAKFAVIIQIQHTAHPKGIYLKLKYKQQQNMIIKGQR